MTSMRCRHGNWPYECPDCYLAVERTNRDARLRDALLVEVAAVVAELAERNGIDATRIRMLLKKIRKP